MEILITYASYYIIVAGIFMLTNSFISGYLQESRYKDDFIGSLFWPIFTANILGTLTRVVVEYIVIKLKRKTKIIKKDA